MNDFGVCFENSQNITEAELKTILEKYGELKFVYCNIKNVQYVFFFFFLGFYVMYRSIRTFASHHGNKKGKPSGKYYVVFTNTDSVDKILEEFPFSHKFFTEKKENDLIAERVTNILKFRGILSDLKNDELKSKRERAIMESNDSFYKKNRTYEQNIKDAIINAILERAVGESYYPKEPKVKFIYSLCLYFYVFCLFCSFITYLKLFIMLFIYFLDY